MLKYHIQTVELTSAQSAIQFNSIPQDYDDLYVVWSTRYVSEGTTKTSILFNNLSSNFSYRLLQGDGSTSATGTNTLALGGINNGSTTTANTFSNNQMLVSNYKSNIAKSYSVDAVSENNATSSFQDIWAGLWNNSAPITSLTITGSSALSIGSSASLYGVKRGDDRVTKVSPVAQGGVVTTSGGYTIHTFNTSGSLIVNRPVEVDYLVVAGGGGGGSRFGGGGGAGGYRYLAGQNLIPGVTYNVAVGAGGAGAAGANVGLAGSDGVGSVFDSNSSAGGGGGAGNHNSPQLALPKDGGSGGGGGGSAAPGTYLGGLGNTPSTSPSQGNNGGSGGNIGTRWSGGGGGGSSAVGTDGNFNVTPNGQGGTGGAGTSNSITGSAVTYAAGGNGGTYLGATLGTAGTTNRGNGGGGSGGESNAGAAGGSGVVIIRYLTP